jgi:hypothetical protein
VSRRLAAPPVISGTPRNHSGTGNHPITRVVIHSAVMPCEPGRARQLGAWNRDGATGGSWHYAVDPAETFQCSYDRFVCWHAPPNGNSLGIEMADYPGHRPTGRTRAELHKLRKAWRWAGKNHRAMLARTVRLTAEILVAENLPALWLSPRDLRAGRRGVTSHDNVSRAWGQSSHWDPGWWPRRYFMRRVRAEVERIRNDERNEK